MASISLGKVAVCQVFMRTFQSAAARRRPGELRENKKGEIFFNNQFHRLEQCLRVHAEQVTPVTRFIERALRRSLSRANNRCPLGGSRVFCLIAARAESESSVAHLTQNKLE